METIMYVIIGIMGLSILFSIVGFIINYVMDKDDRKKEMVMGK